MNALAILLAALPLLLCTGCETTGGNAIRNAGIASLGGMTIRNPVTATQTQRVAGPQKSGAHYYVTLEDMLAMGPDARRIYLAERALAVEDMRVMMEQDRYIRELGIPRANTPPQSGNPWSNNTGKLGLAAGWLMRSAAGL